MTWSTLRAVRLATKLEFTKTLARRHNFVQLPSGRWSRVLGAPGKCAKHVRARVYKMIPGCEW